LNVCLKGYESPYDEEVLNLLEPYVYELVNDWKGSISAEHGIGS